MPSSAGFGSAQGRADNSMLPDTPGSMVRSEQDVDTDFHAKKRRIDRLMSSGQRGDADDAMDAGGDLENSREGEEIPPEYSPTGMRGTQESIGTMEEEEEEEEWNLKHERVYAYQKVTQRLQQRIKNNFKRFIKNFEEEDTTAASAKKKSEDSFYMARLKDMVRDGKKTFYVEFGHMWRHKEHVNLSYFICIKPEGILPLLDQAVLELCMDRFETYRDEAMQVKVSIEKFPKGEPIRKLRYNNINQMVCAEAVITRRGQVFNQIKALYLICEQCSCENGPFDVHSDKDYTTSIVHTCVNCGSHGPWEASVTSTKYGNFQKITLQEPPSSVLAGRLPRSKDGILQGELVDSVKPGDHVLVTGTYKAVWSSNLNIETSFPVFNTEIAINNIAKTHEVNNLTMNQERERQILGLSNETDIRTKLINSVAPSIHGEWHIKQAVALAMFGGVPKIAEGGHTLRGDLNVLVVGDPGMGKSQFLKYVANSFPRSVYTTGKGASGVGLTAAVGRDPETGEWSLEGGAMVLADQGICLIDEFDKMNDQDRTSIHEAMEQQTISIAKAGICTTLQARCAVIAAANPKFGRYDAQLSFSKNVDLTDPILSRFDILNVLKDVPDTSKDDILADFVVCHHMKNDGRAESEAAKIQPRKGISVETIPQDLFRDYVQYARAKCHPKLNEADTEKLAKFYQQIRQESAGMVEGGAKITPRHLDSLLRIAEASAKMELRDYINKYDIQHAIATLLESYCQTLKHQHSELLRKKFKHYILAVAKHDEQMHTLTSKLMREEEEKHLYSGRTEAPEGSNIEDARVTIENLRRAATEYQLNDLVENYLTSVLFKDHFNYHAEEKFISRLREDQLFANFGV